jgi:hypothetical protein
MVLPWPKRINVSLNFGIFFILQFETACEQDENLHHRVEICICNAICEDQTAENCSTVVGIVDVDVSAFGRSLGAMVND